MMVKEHLVSLNNLPYRNTTLNTCDLVVNKTIHKSIRLVKLFLFVKYLIFGDEDKFDINVTLLMTLSQWN